MIRARFSSFKNSSNPKFDCKHFSHEIVECRQRMRELENKQDETVRRLEQAKIDDNMSVLN